MTNYYYLQDILNEGSREFSMLEVSVLFPKTIQTFINDDSIYYELISSTPNWILNDNSLTKKAKFKSTTSKANTSLFNNLPTFQTNMYTCQIRVQDKDHVILEIFKESLNQTNGQNQTNGLNQINRLNQKNSLNQKPSKKKDVLFSKPISIKTYPIYVVTNETFHHLTEAKTKEDLTLSLYETNKNIETAFQHTEATENRKYMLQDEIMTYMRNFNTILFYLYWFLVLIFILRLVIKRKFPNGTIFIITILLITFPYVIDYIEYKIYKAISFVYALMIGSVYTDL